MPPRPASKRRADEAATPPLPAPKKADTIAAAAPRRAPKKADETAAAPPGAAAPPQPPASDAPARRTRPAPALHGTVREPLGPSPRLDGAQAEAFIRALAEANPLPQSELAHHDPFELLVAVVLSAQTTDAAVNRCTPALFAAAPDPAAMAALGEAGIAPFIRSIGLWQGKARNLAALARLLLERHGGEVPRDRAALEALPGVGRKTANVVLNVAFGEEAMAVDTHIFRLGNRTGLAPGRAPREVEDGLVAQCPPGLLRDAHHWLILHGRYVCKARAPECWRCVALRHCNYTNKVLAPPAAAAPKGRGAGR
jgi:endonuclease-3